MTTDLHLTRRALAASLSPVVPTYVLVDPLHGEPVPVDLPNEADSIPLLDAARERGWSRAAWTIPLSPSIELPTHLWPYVVELQGSTDHWLVATLEMAAAEYAQSRAEGLGGPGTSAHSIGGWLQSSQSATDLTTSLSRLMRVDTDASTRLRYQRLADCRVMEWLRCVVGEQRLAGALGRIQSWSYLDVFGQLARIDSSGEAVAPIRLSSPEWTSFMQGASLHQAIARAQGEALSRATPLPGSLPDARACYARAIGAFDSARTAAQRWPDRFAEPADHVAWTALALVAPAILSSHALHTLLDTPSTPGEPADTFNALIPELMALLPALSGTPS